MSHTHHHTRDDTRDHTRRGDCPCGRFGSPIITRRDMLGRTGMGLGTIALTGLLAQEGLLPRVAGGEVAATAADGAAPWRGPHFAPKARAVICLFMGGGPSQVDTFDPKPLLQQLDGKDVPESIARDVPRIARAPLHNLKASPYTFARHGQSGIDVADIFPHIAKQVDDLCVIRSMRHNSPIHAPAEYIALTGTGVGDRPSLGAWVTYGLGSENHNMPAFVVMFSNGKTTRGPGWAAGFLPARFQGTRVESTGIKNLELPAGYTDANRRRQLTLIDKLNQSHLSRHGGDSELEARIASYELAFRMQMAAPEVFDLKQETDATRKLYGVGDGDEFKATNEFATHCLLARRMIERGVRFVQLRNGNWDQHSDLKKRHAEQARGVDQPIAALLADLKARGLFDDTLVIWGGEFGRTPAAQGTGRDHSPSGYSIWLAGAGVKGGQVIGRTDDVGYAAIERPIHPNDLHATILTALGLDQFQLYYDHHNRKEIATVNGGEVIGEVFA